MNPLVIAMSVAKFVPMVAKYLCGNKASIAAEKILDIAESVTGKKEQEALNALKDNPELVLRLESEILKHKESLEKLYLADIQHARQQDRATYDIKIVDIIRGMVRPITTISLIWFFIYCKIANIELSQTDYALILGPVIYYFGERGIMKFRGPIKKHIF